MLDNAVLQDVAAKKMVTPDAKRGALIQTCLVRGVSPRRACEALEVDQGYGIAAACRPGAAKAVKALA
jgi:putative transposase